MKNEEMLIALSAGKRAAYLSELLRPHLEDQKEISIQKLKHLYQTGEYNESKLIGCVAEICALDSLEVSLQEKILTSERIAKELGSE